ncbi:MAG: PAS domain S-box protein [Gammaproteobacteria bacterium]|nr:PAS domain S-box protein [Gammaproteobacteria bacterium]
MKPVLIVDDKEQNLHLLRAMLKAEGFEVEEARHGAEALAKARRRPPQLVISDLLMPVMDGYTLLRQWKADERLRRIPFIVYTATYTEPKDEQLALDLGADAFVMKPAQPSAFISRLKELLAKESAGAFAPHGPPVTDEKVLLREYNETLIHKLEEKTYQLQEKIRAMEQAALERRQVEAQLAESERRFREIFESANVGIGLRGPDDRFLAVNAGFSEITGYSREELLQLHTFDLVHPDDLAESRRMSEAVHRGEARPHQAERRYVKKDGSIIWVKVFSTVVFDDAGKERYSVGVINDITERRRAEQALRTSEERFSTAFKAGPMAISISALKDGRFVDVNDAFLAMFGLQREEVVEKTSVELGMWFSPAHRAALAEELKVKGGFRGREYAFQKRSGESGWALCSAEIVKVGEEKRVISLFIDITERKRAEGTLREREEQLRLFVEHSPAAIAMLDRDMRYLVASRRFLSDYGLGDQDVIGRSHYELFPEIPDRWRQCHQRCLAGAIEKCEEDPFVRADGRTDWVRWEVRPWHTAGGAIGGIIMFTEVITDRKRAETSIRRLNRIYAVLSGINMLIVRERDRQRLFEQVCRIAVEQGQFGLAWIGNVDPGTHSITPMAISGPDADRELITGVKFSAREDRPEGNGTVGQAVRTGKIVYRNDLAAVEGPTPALREFCRRGYRSAISLPILSRAACSAVVVLYSREAGFFDREELTLLSELAEDISFALAYIEQEEKVHFLAYHDALTGLGNRARLRERLDQAVNEARARSHACALLLMNINNFNAINSTLGHGNGDLLLKQIADRIRQALWDSDTVACLGGDEFAVLLPRLASSEDINLVTGKVANAMAGAFTVASLPVSVEPRMGFAIFPDQADSAELLWQRAGMALRAAKELHQRVQYDRSIDHYDPANLALLSGLRSAIDENELVLHYQPKIDLQKRRTCGVEALLRWQHPERGLIYPDRFIPLAERTSLIIPLTNWVLANAMRQGRKWDRAGVRLDIAVNLSARNLQDPNLRTDILNLARRSRFPLRRLTLEITESAIMIDPMRGRTILDELHRAGIRLSMDDFGIGQSSLSYLKDLPITQLKIDKTFVVGFRESRNVAIVRAALEMGHNLGMQVTAEGIEDAATCAALTALGCDVGQGYYFSRPLPPDQVFAWMKSSPWNPGRRSMPKIAPGGVQSAAASRGQSRGRRCGGKPR